MTIPQLRPSPVDESSLKQALERVEKRLRQQEEQRKKNEQHSRTMKLARELASEGIRQRQRSWERSQNKKTREKLQTPGRTKPPSPQTDRAVAEHPKPVTSQAADTKEIKRNKDAGIKTIEPVSEKAPPPKKQGQSDDFSHELKDQRRISKTPSEKEKTKISYIQEADRAFAAKTRKKGLTGLMPIVAWLILCAGIVGAVLSWTTISNVQANTIEMSSGKFNLLPMGLLLGFAYLATGVLGFAFFWVSSLISNQLREIRRFLFLQPRRSEKKEQ